MDWILISACGIVAATMVGLLIVALWRFLCSVAVFDTDGDRPSGYIWVSVNTSVGNVSARDHHNGNYRRDIGLPIERRVAAWLLGIVPLVGLGLAVLYCRDVVHLMDPTVVVSPQHLKAMALAYCLPLYVNGVYHFPTGNARKGIIYDGEDLVRLQSCAALGVPMALLGVTFADAWYGSVATSAAIAWFVVWEFLPGFDLSSWRLLRVPSIGAWGILVLTHDRPIAGAVSLLIIGIATLYAAVAFSSTATDNKFWVWRPRRLLPALVLFLYPLFQGLCDSLATFAIRRPCQNDLAVCFALVPAMLFIVVWPLVNVVQGWRKKVP